MYNLQLEKKEFNLCKSSIHSLSDSVNKSIIFDSQISCFHKYVTTLHIYSSFGSLVCPHITARYFKFITYNGNAFCSVSSKFMKLQ